MEGFRNRGTAFTGRNTQTHQKKKHYTMMSQEELLNLKGWAQKRDVTTLIVSSHFLEKSEIKLNPYQIKRILESHNLEELIIEYNQKDTRDGLSQRILLRDDEAEEVEFVNRNGRKFKAMANLCIVIDLKSWTLVTAYWNKASDHHQHMDWSYYTPSLKIEFGLKN